MTRTDLSAGTLSLANMRQYLQAQHELSLSPQVMDAVGQSAAVVLEKVQHEETIYGINTGFGLLADQRVDQSQLSELQHRLILSHACGTGELLDDETVRLILLLKINSLARGYSGIRPELMNALLTLYNKRVCPCIPAQGSVGASGDLAPLAHLSAVLIGEGEARVDGKLMSAEKALKYAGLKPMQLAAKEGLALLNGTQVSTALALRGLFAAEELLASAMVIGAMTTDAAQGSSQPFDSGIHKVRGHAGQIKVAAVLRDLLQGSAIHAAHADCDKVQDPYSLRCQPQVLGACWQQLKFAAEVLEVEANAVSDNPLVFAHDGRITSGGNFHAEPVAMAADNIALAIAEISALAERRIAMLVDPRFSGLPAFLVRDNGLNSGFMIAHVTAASLASENKHLASPVSVDSLPTSANQEDHVSMATYAARRLQSMLQNLEGILAVELMSACQALDLRQPLLTSDPLRQVHTMVREQVPFLEHDQLLSPYISTCRDYVTTELLINLANPSGLFASYER